MSQRRREEVDRVHGNMYQKKLLMLFLYRGVSHKHSFRLGTEIKEAKKFDDLVFEYTKNGTKEYRLVQSKHRSDECEKINADHLLTESDGDFSLTKYFFSYQDSKKEKLFKDGSIKDVTICTNIDFDLEQLKIAQILVEEIDDKDDILDFESNEKIPKRYRFNEDVASLLKPKLQHYNITRLARRLAECFIQNNLISHHDNNDIFRPYHLALAEEVIDTKNKTFHNKFIKDGGISEDAKKLRMAFIEEIGRKSKEKLTLEDINEAITNKREIIDNKKVGLNLSKNFGKGEDKNWPNNLISDNEIKDFLKHLVFAVNQPNEEELGKIVEGELGKGFNLDSNTTEQIYNKFFIRMLDFLQGKGEDRFLSYEEGKEFFEEARRGIPIWFGVKAEHFVVTSTLVNLGNTLGKLGDPNKQQKLLERALAIQEKHYGAEPYNIFQPAHSQKAISQRRREEVNGLHGYMYHTKLLMLFLYRGVSQNHSFRLGTEIKEAKKFHVLVFECTKNGTKEYRLVQSEHRLDECKKITADHLLTESDGDFSLTKYFFSYQDSKKEELFKDGSIKDVTICTNIDFDFERLKIAHIRVEEIVGKDDILDFESNEKIPKRYRFNEDVASLLKPKIQHYNITRLARKLAECFIQNNPISHHDNNDIFRSYHLALAEEVINTKNKTFHDRFIKDRGISEDAKTLRTAFIEEIRRKSKGKLTLEYINEAITKKREIIDNKKVGLNLSKNFGKGEDKNWPNNVISDNEIKDFLKHLVFAVNQPNEEELGKIVEGELGKEFNLDSNTTEQIYNKFLRKMIAFLQGKGGDRFLSHEEGKEFFEEARRGIPIWFGVRESLQSFTGRQKQLETIHKALQSRGETAISQVASVSGLGGIGKTELARKYAYLHGDDYHGNVIWIDAESYQTLVESFRRLASDKLEINTKNAEEKEKDIKSIVEDVYGFFSKRKCLFIFDNAEKLRTQVDDDEGIDKFLPSLPSNANKPYILITSRNQNWGDIEVIGLGTFTKEEATHYLREALNIKDDSQKQGIEKLTEILQRFPLALAQAVAFIKQADEEVKNVEPDKEYKIGDYLEEYQKKMKELLITKLSIPR